MTPDVRTWLAELDAARAAATPGEWASYWGDHIGSGVVQISPGGVTVEHDIALVRDEDDRACTDNTQNPAEPAADADLIVAAVNALPELTARLRAVLSLADELSTHTVEPETDTDRAFIRGLDLAAARIRAAAEGTTP